MKGLKAATESAHAALEAGNLEALHRALDARRQAIDAGEQPTLDIYESGQRLMRALLDYQRQAAYESARMDQVRRYLVARL